MQHIARISYGKDSLKMLEVIHSRKMPLDRITTTDVWATDTISANLPQMEAFKAEMDERIWKMYRIDVEHLCARNPDGSKKTYEQMFYHVPRRRQTTVLKPHNMSRGCVCDENGIALYKKQGTITGFPGIQNGTKWCQNLKVVDVDKNDVSYIGIASDEPKRFGQLNDRLRAPLVEFDIDEGLCGLYCKYGNMLSPSYETSFRDGCWFCHNQGVKQLRYLRKGYPDLWALLLKWDLDSPVTFKADGHTVHDYDTRFQLEDEKLIDPNKPFRWAMLDGDLQKRLF